MKKSNIIQTAVFFLLSGFALTAAIIYTRMGVSQGFLWPVWLAAACWLFLGTINIQSLLRSNPPSILTDDIE